MDFLREILGEELYKQVADKINAHNGDEANKDKQIKIGNLGSGEYVGKAKHEAELDKLNALLSGKDGDIQNLTATLESLKKGKVDADAIQSKLAESERLLAESKARETATKIKYALRDLLRDENVADVDYAEYLVQKKLVADGKNLELDKSEKIKGSADLIDALKTQSPSVFGNKSSSGVTVEPLPLPVAKSTSGTTRSELLRKPYAERAAFATEHPEAYNEIMHNN